MKGVSHVESRINSLQVNENKGNFFTFVNEIRNKTKAHVLCMEAYEYARKLNSK